ncbi:MAG: flagellar brake protein [Sulfuriferula sp.]
MNTATNPPTPAATNRYASTFDDIKARIGDVFQVQISTDSQEIRHSVKLLGYFPGKTIMITTPTLNNNVMLFREGQTLTVRAFSGTAAYVFNADVLKACNTPITYLHLSYPKTTQKVPIRASTRINFDIIGASSNITRDENSNAAPTAIIINDISTTGASIAASSPLGKKDDILRIAFRAKIHDIMVHPTLKCVIRSLTSTDDEVNPIKYGLQFLELDTQELLTLQSLVYQKILENK